LKGLVAMEDVFRCIDFDFFSRFLEGLQKFLGDKCEIVIHDYRKGYDNSLVYAINAQLSGRKVGDSPRGGMIANVGKDIDSLKDSKIFFYAGAKGQLFKSCTTLIADENNKIIGSICMNMEISEFILAQNAIQNFIQHKINDCENETSSADILTKNVDEMLSYYIQQSEQLIGKPMPLMSKEEKIKALDYLDQKGVFKITKASNLLCDAFKISRFTLYGYLEEAKNQRKSE
jgi:predicted transcriptional regulator YheO